MAKKAKDPIPDSFASRQEAADFWDTHSLEDYPEYLQEITDVEIDIQERRIYVPIAVFLDKQAREIARRQGISTETLINLWIKEKIEEYEQNIALKPALA